MIVELALVFSFAIHLRHLLERIEHSLHDLVVGRIDALADLQGIRPNKLGFHAADISGEVFDERRHALALLAGELCLLDGLDVIGLIKGDVSILQYGLEKTYVPPAARRAL